MSTFFPLNRFYQLQLFYVLEAKIYLNFRVPLMKINNLTKIQLIQKPIIRDNKQVISETFNDFFCNIGRNLANKFSNSSIEDYKTYLNNPAEQSLLLYRIKQEEIKDAIFQLNNSNSSGHDEITSKFVKLSSEILIPVKIKVSSTHNFVL